MSTPPVPKLMPIGQVPKYLKDFYGMEISRQSVYNWTKKGLRDDTLQTTVVKGKPTSKHPTVVVTTEQWVDQFLRRCGIECTKTVRCPNPAGPAEDAGAGPGEADLGPGGGPAISPPRSYPESESDVPGWDEVD